MIYYNLGFISPALGINSIKYDNTVDTKVTVEILQSPKIGPTRQQADNQAG